jgi:hypothetical protein
MKLEDISTTAGSLTIVTIRCGAMVQQYQRNRVMNSTFPRVTVVHLTDLIYNIIVILVPTRPYTKVQGSLQYKHVFQ